MNISKKINVCLIFGGRSGEHEVSLQSAKSIYDALDKTKYNVFLVGIDKSGKWLLGNASNYLLNETNPKLIALNNANDVLIITAISKKNNTQLISVQSGKEMGSIDVFFPIIHGTYGEDGCLQGMMEMLNVAYVGAGVIGSAIGMDKDVMKRLLNYSGIKTAHFSCIHKHEATKAYIDTVVQQFTYPFFVKPANSGSSVGISKVHNPKELEKAIQDAFQYDTKILIEEYIKGREIECAILGNHNPKASIPGEIIPQHEFYSYEAKYIDENGALLKLPAELTQEQIKQIQQTAINAFTVLECSGMARVDFFLKDNGEVVLNEINTIPGFTKISMYPKLWNLSGVSYSELIDELIKLALEKKQEENSLKRTYTI
ncbi:MAG: D-alanine--D-alanine ligase [bacterium]|nr:D-alanine--D-alanine ligase [bacterium]